MCLFIWPRSSILFYMYHSCTTFLCKLHSILHGYILHLSTLIERLIDVCILKKTVICNSYDDVFLHIILMFMYTKAYYHCAVSFKHR